MPVKLFSKIILLKFTLFISAKVLPCSLLTHSFTSIVQFFKVMFTLSLIVTVPIFGHAFRFNFQSLVLNKEELNSCEHFWITTVFMGCVILIACL